MEDLLNEDDFKLTYNPWPRFRKYYMYAVVSLFVWLLASLIVMNLLEDNLITTIGFFLSPYIMSWLMYFRKRENAFLPYLTIIKSICLLAAIYYIPILFLTIFSSGVIPTLISGVVSIIIILVPPLLNSASLKKKNSVMM